MLWVERGLKFPTPSNSWLSPTRTGCPHPAWPWPSLGLGTHSFSRQQCQGLTALWIKRHTRVEQVIQDSWHSFTKGRLCLTNLVTWWPMMECWHHCTKGQQLMASTWDPAKPLARPLMLCSCMAPAGVVRPGLGSLTQENCELLAMVQRKPWGCSRAGVLLLWWQAEGAGLFSPASRRPRYGFTILKHK